MVHITQQKTAHASATTRGAQRRCYELLSTVIGWHRCFIHLPEWMQNHANAACALQEFEKDPMGQNTFDSSYQRGSPTSFAPNQVIGGWTEAMQLMVEGDKWELYIPSEYVDCPRRRGSSRAR
eukprot:6214545-Pleurochrysis_carterae.AAC.2